MWSLQFSILTKQELARTSFPDFTFKLHILISTLTSKDKVSKQVVCVDKIVSFHFRYISFCKIHSVEGGCKIIEKTLNHAV